MNTDELLDEFNNKTFRFDIWRENYRKHRTIVLAAKDEASAIQIFNLKQPILPINFKVVEIPEEEACRIINATNYKECLVKVFG